MQKAILAVDIGGSKYMTGLISLEGKLIRRTRREWTGYSRPLIREQLLGSIRETLDASPGWTVIGGGATIPGLADPERGLWVSTAFMGIKDYPVARDLTEVFGFPFHVENDGRACVLGERYFGAGQDCEDFLYVTVSNGIGGGLFLDGRLYRGATGSAGEIGQCVVVDNGRISEDGTRGTLEMHAAAAGLVQNYLEAGGRRRIDGRRPDGKLIAGLAAEGDPAALETFRLEGYYLGKAIAALHNVLDLKKVILGGGLSLAFDLYKDALTETVRSHTYKRAYECPEILPTPLGYDGALWGAAALVLHTK